MFINIPILQETKHFFQAQEIRKQRAKKPQETVRKEGKLAHNQRSRATVGDKTRV